MISNKKKKLLLLSRNDPAGDPRPNRMIEWLREDYDVDVVSNSLTCMENVTAYAFPQNPARAGLGKMKKAFLFLAGFYNAILFPKNVEQLSETLKIKNYDLIICHSIDLLPFALKIKGRAKIVMDLREYYPEQFNDVFKWRLFFKSYYKYLCRTYLPRVDHTITVCDGIAGKYQENYGIECHVIKSCAKYYGISPSRVQPDKIRMIYHGGANSSRKIENMIETMKFLDKRFALDLMLVGSEKYIEKLRSLTVGVRNVNIIPPVAFKNIIPYTNNYDIGFFLCPPSNLNLLFSLPNKFFEFIQARLMIAIGPSPEMQRLVERYEIGIVADDFKPQTLAKKLSALTAGDIAVYKKNSHIAASELNAEKSREQFISLLKGHNKIKVAA